MEPLLYNAVTARRLLAEGSPGAAETIARAALAQRPEDPESWRVLAAVAEAVGERFLAARYAAAAAAVDLGTAAPAAALEAGTGGLPARDPDRFLLIKAWGYGFFSDLDHVLGCLLLAEMTGRTPVTHWGTNSLFRIDSGTDAFRSYFSPLSPQTI